MVKTGAGTGLSGISSSRTRRAAAQSTEIRRASMAAAARAETEGDRVPGDGRSRRVEAGMGMDYVSEKHCLEREG